jgi:hypothetical protein
MTDALQFSELYWCEVAGKNKQQAHMRLESAAWPVDMTHPQTLITQLQTSWQLHAAVWLWQSDLNGRQAVCFRRHGLHRQLASQGFKMKRILLISLSYSSMPVQQQNQLLVLAAMALILTYTGAVTDLHHCPCAHHTLYESSSGSQSSMTAKRKLLWGTEPSKSESAGCLKTIPLREQIYEARCWLLQLSCNVLKSNCLQLLWHASLQKAYSSLISCERLGSKGIHLQ